MQKARYHIEQMLNKGKLGAAIEASLLLCSHYEDNERSSTAAQHSARYHSLMSDYHEGTINNDHYRPERARINRAMLDLAHSIPPDWTDEPLTQAGFSPNGHDKVQAQPKKSFFEKWGLILGVVASLMAIMGVTLRDMIFAKKEVTAAQTFESKADPSANKSATQPTAKESQNAGESATTTSAKTPSTKPNNPPAIVQKPKTDPVSLATTDKVFRSFSKTKIVDGMERGKSESKMAFRNIQTREIICCFADAEDFSGGKAYVSKDGVAYYYIDKKGNKVE